MGERCAAVEARILMRPDLAKPPSVARSIMVSGVRPDTTSPSAGAKPLYGTWVMCTPARWASNSMPMWADAPMPFDA
jgi:hypothetical protein